MNIFSKVFLFSACFLFANALNAATVSIAPGETITLNANEYTTVTCNGNGGGPIVDCKEKNSLLKQRLELCGPNNDDSWCVDNIWPLWKANNPTCVDEGSITCQVFCF